MFSLWRPGNQRRYLLCGLTADQNGIVNLTSELSSSPAPLISHTPSQFTRTSDGSPAFPIPFEPFLRHSLFAGDGRSVLRDPINVISDKNIPKISCYCDPARDGGKELKLLVFIPPTAPSLPRRLHCAGKLE